MGFVFPPTIIGCVASALLATSLTLLFMRNSKMSNGNKCDVCHSRRDTEGNRPPCGERRKPLIPQDLELVVLRDAAVRDGAVCLDGSAPGYYLKKGHGNGSHRWILHLQGGAWCSDNESCYQRSHSKYGSIKYTNNNRVPSRGLYSRDRRTNPDFYNWNIVFVIYCDGSSFTGMRTNSVYFKNKAVYFRGMLILKSVINDVLERGVRNASDVLLTGSSAGSLAVLIHADYIKSKLPRKAKFRAVSDSGYFADFKTQCGIHKTREVFRGVLKTHNATSGLHERCLKHTTVDQRWKCLFPQYFFKFIQTPVFVLQSAYDVWQIPNYLDIVCTIPNYDDLILFNSVNAPFRGTGVVLGSNDLGGQRKKREASDSRYSYRVRTFDRLDENIIKKNFTAWHWQGLYSYPAACTKVETQMILSSRNVVLDALKPVMRRKRNGVFLSSCFEHTQAAYDQIWKQVKIRGKTIRQAIHEWYIGKPGNHFHIAKPLSFASCVP